MVASVDQFTKRSTYTFAQLTRIRYPFPNFHTIIVPMPRISRVIGKILTGSRSVSGAHAPG